MFIIASGIANSQHSRINYATWRTLAINSSSAMCKCFDQIEN